MMMSDLIARLLELSGTSLGDIDSDTVVDAAHEIVRLRGALARISLNSDGYTNLIARAALEESNEAQEG